MWELIYEHLGAIVDLLLLLHVWGASVLYSNMQGLCIMHNVATVHVSCDVLCRCAWNRAKCWIHCDDSTEK
jgi:hypothetical protein